MSKSACVEPAASSASPYASASADALEQVDPSSLPDAPPKETRTVAPDSFSAEIREATAESSTALAPFHFGVQLLPSEMTKARLYVAGEPAESFSEASPALTYGA